MLKTPEEFSEMRQALVGLVQHSVLVAPDEGSDMTLIAFGRQVRLLCAVDVRSGQAACGMVFAGGGACPGQTGFVGQGLKNLGMEQRLHRLSLRYAIHESTIA